MKILKLKHKCEGKVRFPGRWTTYYPCKNSAPLEHEGKWYCGIHDPVRGKERQEALEKERIETEEIECPFCHKRFVPLNDSVPNQKGKNMKIETPTLRSLLPRN